MSRLLHFLRGKIRFQMSEVQIDLSMTGKNQELCGCPSLVRHLSFSFYYTCVSKYRPVRERTGRTHYVACLPLYLEVLISPASATVIFLRSILRVHGHSTHSNQLILLTAQRTLVTRTCQIRSYALFRGKKILFPYIALALCYE